MEDTGGKQCELSFTPDIMYYPEIVPVFLELCLWNYAWICIIVILDKNVTLIIFRKEKISYKLNCWIGI